MSLFQWIVAGLLAVFVIGVLVTLWRFGAQDEAQFSRRDPAVFVDHARADTVQRLEQWQGPSKGPKGWDARKVQR